jgi:nucleotide-binding universal stress UspA family protein
MSNEGLIVVGVDGSESARTALEFALAEAARRSARVRAVIAFHPPQYWPVLYGGAPMMIVPPSTEQLAADADRTVQQTVAEATADVGSAAQAVPLEVRVVQGDPARVLIDQAADADLLVVGHRGLGAIASACLGSVGLQCVMHATCPVIVVRPVTVVRPVAGSSVRGKAAAAAVAGQPA